MLINHSIIHAQYEPLAKYWGVPVEKVPELLAIEQNLIMVDGILKPRLDTSSFGGTYINAKENKVFINTLNSSMIPIVKSFPEIKPYIDLLSFLNATKSSYQLNTTFNELTILAQKLNAYNVEIGINPKFNNIVIYLNHKDDKVNKNFIDSAAKFNPIMQYSETYPTDSTPLESNIEKRKRLIEYRLLDGDGLHDRDGDTVCSVGLWVRDSNGQDYIMTAGHCDFASPRNPQGFVDFYQKGWYSLSTYNYIGPLEYFSYAPYDFGLIRYNSTNVTLTTLICNFDHQTIYPVLYVKNVGVVTSSGTSLCKSGETTHVTCGEVIALVTSATFHYPDSNHTDIKKDFFKTDIKCDSGDSGGTVFYYDALRIPYVLVAGTVIGGTNSTCNFLSIPVSFRAARVDFNLNLTVVYTPQNE
ncbi:hypothetical protein C2G38_1399120 [Gigaspora rosea]|uniref:Peptidase S1 domain-containing protein n=1 Tax=Gigaspora rosea TaxID=44941 RepID=A0A397TRD6_9GLOM|nr:hypothetical protein C2G38_1399120 [Gigaspora rosea]